MFRSARWLILAAAPLVGCKRTPPPPEPGAAPVVAASAELLPPPLPSRCDAPPEGSVVSLGDERGAEDGDSLPFAVEVGQGVAFDDGFAVGALMPDKTRGAKASVVTLGPEGGSSKIIPLMTAHGDTPPPKLAAMGKALLVGILESSASSRRFRIGRVEGGQVAWALDLDQARDESLAFDLLAGASRGVAVWDDESRDTDGGVVKLVSFDLKNLASSTAPKTLSPKGTDAEMPRLAPRPGGFWLTWIARKPEKTDDGAREVGEAPEFRWLEAMPLDERGVPTGSPRRISPEKGHVLTYDIQALPEGRALIVFRDDDTPSGSSGGMLLKLVLRPDGASEPAILAERHVGVGIPALLPGWFAMADASAETRLARLAPSGDLSDRLESEPVLGRGEPLAARGDALLVLRPRGQSVRLFVTRCRDQGPPEPAPAPASSP